MISAPTHPPETSGSQRGVLIAGSGLPGAGKSSVFRALAELAGWPCFLEPEEPEWPPAVKQQSSFGTFTALAWFRSIRVPHLVQAAALRASGEITLVDTYYDKLLGYYIRKPEMSWLIDRADPYFEVSAAMAELDQRYLPNADVIVFFRLTADLWDRLVQSRSRAMDQSSVFPPEFSFQSHLYEATEAYCRSSGAHLLVFDPPFASPAAAADALLAGLMRLGFAPSAKHGHTMVAGKTESSGEICGSGV